ncbi:uncharacterized protein LOC142973117 [Anticarsia gemmatalis]|uniref:uncharacterized protein LOC142973117 n=1 Tax=Anticarsia gemmatalis TaxID=129554 RepID=UPI003F76A206
MKMFAKVCLVISCLAMVQAAPRQKRLTIAENVPSYYYSNIDGNPDVYSFGYDVSDPETGNSQFRSEQRHPNGTVTGNYGYIDPAGMPQRFKYIADKGGYRVYPDYVTLPPIPKPLAGNEHLESSVTWTRPPKKNKKKLTISNDLVAKLGVLFSHSLHV